MEIDKVATPEVSPVVFLIRPISGDLLGSGIDLGHLVKRAVESEGAKRVNERIAQDISDNRKWDDQAYDRQVTKKEFTDKVWKGHEVRMRPIGVAG